MSRRRPPAPPVAPPRDWTIVAIAAFGAVLSAYLAIVKGLGGTAAFCEAGSGCDIVQASRWAAFLGVPTAAWGAVLYVIVIVLALVGLTAQRWLATFVLATVALTFSAYLTGVSLFVLRAVCPYCVTDAVVALALFVTVLLRRPAAGRRSPARPARLAAVGGGTAVATIVLAAAVWLGGSTSAYADALARHLSTDGSVMYGAFW